MEENQRKGKDHIFAGLFLIVAGVVWLAYRAGAYLPEWIVTWEMGLICLGIFILIRHNFRNTGGYILLLVGAFNLADRQLPDVHFHEYLIPIIVIGVGLLYITRPGRRGWSRRNRKDWKDSYSWKAPEADVTNKDSDDYFEATAVFSGIKSMQLSKNFKGGSVDCVFGGAEIDLTQADIQDKAVLELKLVFGGVKLLVPPNWVVQNEISGVFHGVDDKRPWQSTNIDTKKILVLHGFCVFAGIEIRSY